MFSEHCDGVECRPDWISWYHSEIQRARVAKTHTVYVTYVSSCDRCFSSILLMTLTHNGRKTRQVFIFLYVLKVKRETHYAIYVTFSRRWTFMFCCTELWSCLPIGNDYAIYQRARSYNPDYCSFLIVYCVVSYAFRNGLHNCWFFDCFVFMSDTEAMLELLQPLKFWMKIYSSTVTVAYFVWT